MCEKNDKTDISQEANNEDNAKAGDDNKSNVKKVLIEAELLEVILLRHENKLLKNELRLLRERISKGLPLLL